MRAIFADTVYWVALVNPRDQWRAPALEVSELLSGARIVTTQEVLVEFLNSLGASGEHIRMRAAGYVLHLEADPAVEVVSQSRDTFAAGLILYRSRPDKEYSLTDCISMCLMRERGITEVLTHDHHFAQEGFTILL